MVKKHHRKPRQHVRHYRSNNRRVLVNKGVNYSVYREKGIVSPAKKEIFRHLGDKDFETIGYMDFGRRGLERATMNYGWRDYSEMEDDPDFEGTYHTHPHFGNKFIDYINHFPSKEDMYDFINSDDQFMNVVHDGAFTTITKTPAYSKMKKNDIRAGVKRIEAKLVPEVKKNYRRVPITDYMKSAAKEFEEIGFRLTFQPNTNNGELVIPIRVVEPKRQKRSASLNVSNAPLLIKSAPRVEEMSQSEIDAIKGLLLKNQKMNAINDAQAIREFTGKTLRLSEEQVPMGKLIQGRAKTPNKVHFNVDEIKEMANKARGAGLDMGAWKQNVLSPKERRIYEKQIEEL